MGHTVMNRDTISFPEPAVNPDSPNNLEVQLACLGQIVDIAPGAIMAIDGEGGVLFANERASLMHGYEKDEFLKLNILDLVAPGSVELVELRIRRIHESGEVEFESMHRRKDQSIFPAQVYARTSQWNGRPAIISVTNDITERKKLENALRERVKELHCLHRISKACHNGTSLEDILEQSVDALPSGLEFPEAACARIIAGSLRFQTENFRETEWRLIADLTIQGKTIGAVELYYLEERPARDEGPFLEEERNLVELVAERLERTIEREEMAKAIRDSEKRFRALFSSIGDAIMVADAASGMIVDANTMAQSLTGRSRVELLAMHQSQLHPPDLLEALQESFSEQAVSSGDLVETRLRHASGHDIDVEIRPSVNFEMLGRPCIIGVFRDITERKRAERQIQQMELELRHTQKMEAVGQLAAGVAHEINNPVGFVMSNLGTLQEYTAHLKTLLELGRNLDPDIPGLPPELKTSIESLDRDELTFIAEDLDGLLAECIDGCERVRDIVQNLKSFVRAEDELVAADLQECVESTLKIVWNELKYRCEVVKQYGEVPQVTCRIGEINQVIMNLLVNAAQAIGEQGTITITTRREQQIGVLEVADTGCGIAPEHLSRVFDPFFTTKPVGTGTGLGLNICHKIIEQHGGTISVASTVGAGTTFTVRLPLAGTEPSEEGIVG